MTRSRLIGITGFLLVFGTLQAAAVADRITIDESRMRLSISDKAVLRLPVTNTTPQPISTTLRLEFLEPDNKLVHELSLPFVLAAGSTILEAEVPGFLRLDSTSQPNYGWLRLRYSMAGGAVGIVSVSKIAPEPFLMTVVTPHDAVPGNRYRLQVVAQDPALGKPVPNVEVSGRLSSDDEQPLVLVKAVRTNSSGYAELNFELPKLSSDTELSLEVTGKLRKFVRKIAGEISVNTDLSVLTSMDKPLYQPGQALRLRALVFDRRRNVSRGAPLELSIWDPADDKVFQTSLVTSEFGEAHTQWEIPENARTGNYQIRIEPEDGYESREFVWIGRYDIPAFSIDVRQDRPYYTPADSSEVDIRTTYLFGKPLPLAHVKVVRENYRSWNYRDLKWDVEEGEVVEGIADTDGRFRARLKLDTEFERLSERSSFADLAYGVYVTDPSTGRTEQRRFWTRITLYPIHLYVTGAHPTRNLPLEFYVTASYADGTPAICDVEILEVRESDRAPLGTVKTNRYGVAKVTSLQPSPDFGADVLPQLELRASDSTGRKGQSTQYFFPQKDSLRVYTDKSIYRATEPIAVRVESTISSGQLVVNASSDERILYSTAVQLSGGKAAVLIPGTRSFNGRVVVSAYHASAMDDSLFEGRQVLFPSKGGLEIEATFARKTYSPGEDATLKFRVRNGNGNSEKALIGVTVFDKGVEERARTDASFNGRYSTCRYCERLSDDDLRLPGFTRADLDRVDRSKPVPQDLDLAAEVLLLGWDLDLASPSTLGDFEPVGPAFRTNSVQQRFDALQFSTKYPSGFHLPPDEELLRKMVLEVDPGFDSLRDPWNNLYRLTSSVSLSLNRIEILSSGADEALHTPDDFRVASIQWPYFREYGHLVRTALVQYNERTGGYVREIQVLKDELRSLGHDFDAWHDPVGRPFTVEFGVDRTRFTVTIKSAEWIVWSEGVDYTAELQPRIDTALNDAFRQQRAFPQTHAELSEILMNAGISDRDLRDPWGRLYYSSFSRESGYFDSVTYLSGAAERVRIVPVTREVQVIRLRSIGRDGIEGTRDDFTTMSFARPLSEQTVEEAAPGFVEGPILDPSRGTIHGSVIDRSGALIPGARIKISGPLFQDLELITGDSGEIFVPRLAVGLYRVQVSLPGFQTKVLSGVVVRAGIVTRIIATLEVASLATLVEVSVESPSVLESSSASLGMVEQRNSGRQGPLSTPRLREYFPETLLWDPALETEADGQAQVRFKLADSMTTWKAVAIASARDGRIAITEQEIVAFQPFFVEHDPPRILTEGDQIALPVVVRSYLDRDQSVELSMKGEAWFTSLDEPSRKVSIKPGDFLREVFSFKARTPVKNGRQRITAQGSAASDAIEKTSTVYPFGREMSQISGSVFRGSSSHTIAIPAEALPGSVRAELKIYPNLMAHVVDAIEGIMQRPHGCAEQVISSAYPSLLFLNYAKDAGLKSDPLSLKAKRYLNVALQTLRGYKNDNGGFSYWARGEPNAAVTAYALQFLTEAKQFIEINDELLSGAREWLLKQQAGDGSWQTDLPTTAYIANVLAKADPRRDKDRVMRALGFLQKRSMQPAEPYVTASIALAALHLGEKQIADEALTALRAEVHYERDGAYWDLQTNTPFYSWGLPGRLETTSVVLRAFAAAGSDSELVNKGLLFLLQNKDQFGVWHSTQATVRVLDVLVRLVGNRENVSGSARVVVNGVAVATMLYGTREQPNNPVILDLAKHLKTGNNTVEVTGQRGASIASIQLVESHYVPWKADASDLSSGPLRLSVRYDRVDSTIDDPITVRVEAERVGFRGYGMMLAEIGLPPGAQVDRESLEKAAAGAGWELSRYDVLPDRVIAYIWPRGGGTKFEFQFRPRYGLEAHTPPSKLYDYYNPDAYSILLPEHFRIR